MDLSKIKLFALMQQKMAYHSERQSHLAQNVANANTPGYKAKDLQPIAFDELVHRQNSAGVETTHAGHIQSSARKSRFETIAQKDTFETTPTGNNVVLEEQMLKMSENSFDYQTTTNMYKKMTDLMKAALGNRQ